MVSVRLTSVDHFGCVEVVQAEEDLVDCADDELFIEDVLWLHLLQCPQAHTQGRHDENLVVAVLARHREGIIELAKVLFAGTANHVGGDIG
jgi:hypothetical protein